MIKTDFTDSHASEQERVDALQNYRQMPEKQVQKMDSG